MFVITGASGNTGSVVARQLLSQGKPVRVLARSADKVRGLAESGAEVVLGELSQRDSLERAFAGASGVYLLSPPDMAAKSFLAERGPLMESVVAAAKAAQVKHVVLLSSIGAQHAEGTGPIQGLHTVERALRASGIPSTFVRAAYFTENWAAVLPVAKKDGVLPSFIPASFKMPMVATSDIGQTAARAMLEGPRGVRVLELSGPVDVSPTEVAAAVSRLLGREIKLLEAPLEGVVPTFTSFGISADVAGLYREMYEGMRSGKVAWEGGQAEALRGKVGMEEALRNLLG